MTDLLGPKPCECATLAYTGGKNPTAYWATSTLGCVCKPEPTEHRWPRKRRESYPQMFVLWYTLRRVTFFTPKVGLRAWQVTVSTLPRRGWLLGIDVYRDEDDDLIVRFGLVLLDVEVNTIHFYPESYWTDRTEAADA